MSRDDGLPFGITVTVTVILRLQVHSEPATAEPY